MKVKELEALLKTIPVTNSIEVKEYIHDEVLRRLTDPRRKNGLSNRIFKTYSHYGKFLIWRIM